MNKYNSTFDNTKYANLRINNNLPVYVSVSYKHSNTNIITVKS